MSVISDFADFCDFRTYASLHGKQHARLSVVLRVAFEALQSFIHEKLPHSPVQYMQYHATLCWKKITHLTNIVLG